MFWTSAGTAGDVVKAFVMNVEALDAGLRSIGASARPESVSVSAGSETREGSAVASELDMVVGSLVGSGRRILRATWRGIELEVAESPANPGLWSAQTFSTPSLDNAVLDAVANGWATALDGLAANGWAMWGGITTDHGMPNYTPYETYFPIGWERGERLAAEHPRGYYWTNLLTAHHVEQLGGIAAITEYCGAYGLLATAHWGGQSVIVRCPGPISQFDDEKLAAVYGLLDPILLHEPYRWYAGWSLRVFKEPGTAFQQIEPTVQAHLPVFDDDEPMPDDDNW